MSADIRRCVVCGAPLPQRRRVYCSDECMRKREYDRAKEAYAPTGKERSVYTTRACAECGVMFRGHIRSYRCPACQAEADRRHDAEYKRRAAAGRTRAIGSTAYCTVCGGPYTVQSGGQMYCPDCKVDATSKAVSRAKAAWNRSARKDPQKRAEIHERVRIKDPVERICKECAKPFLALGSNSVFCCTDCRTAYRHRYMQEYDARRREAKAERSRKLREELTDEQRAEINRKAREAYARRKQKKEPGH